MKLMKNLLILSFTPVMLIMTACEDEKTEPLPEYALIQDYPMPGRTWHVTLTKSL